TTTTSEATTTTTTQAPTTTTTTQAPAGSFNAARESQFLALINGLRSTPLLSDSSLKVHARNWARYMAETDKLSHSSLGSLLDPWSTVGENVAFGYSALSMFEALSASSAHRANMVSKSFTHVGIGAWIDADGQTWTAHVFGG
ncbi:MAG: CAP domain-containing protein, partial [Acidimicrobiia bacterium]